MPSEIRPFAKHVELENISFPSDGRVTFKHLRKGKELGPLEVLGRKAAEALDDMLCCEVYLAQRVIGEQHGISLPDEGLSITDIASDLASMYHETHVAANLREGKALVRSLMQQCKEQAGGKKSFGERITQNHLHPRQPHKQ